MAHAFDTLAYAKRLEAAGVKRAEAEAHAAVVKDLVMADIVTKSDLQAALDRQTIKLGAIIVAVTGMLFAALRLFPH